MFGLITTATLEATASLNARRRVFYQMPNGAFPLMGLLSLMDDKEQTDKTTFGWWERRYVPTRSYTAQATAAGPFTDTSGGSGAVGTDLTAAGWSKVVGDVIRIKVADASVFRERDNVWVKDIAGTASSIKNIKGTVTAVWTSPNTIDIRLIEPTTNALNSVANNGIIVIFIGSAAVEGGYSKKGGMILPIEVNNYTQIFRTVIGPFSRNALKEGQKFDSTGIYKSAAKDSQLRHMEAMEQACYWGVKSTQTITDSDDGESKPIKTTGGLHWFLYQWEKGNVANGGAFDYRPGGTDVTALAWDASDDKRILKFSGGSISLAQWNTVIERAFVNNTNVGWEKVVICGNGLLSVINSVAEQSATKMIKLNETEDTYGLQIVSWQTVFGTLHFKTHPLFTQNPALKYCGFIVDVGTLGYHAFQDSDTTLLKNRQANDADGRKDEWLTEFGLEINLPENNLYIDDLRGISL